MPSALEGGDFFVSAGRRLPQGRRGEGGGKPGGRGRKRVGVGGTELISLHPAWRPKGLTRRQRAVSTIDRG